MSPIDALPMFDAVRDEVAGLSIAVGSHNIGLTVSIGLCTKQHDSLDRMITNADEKLFKAGGRNRFVI